MKKVPVLLAQKPAETEVKNEIKRDINYDPLAKPTICAISDKTSLISSTLMANSSDNDNSFEYAIQSFNNCKNNYILFIQILIFNSK